MFKHFMHIISNYIEPQNKSPVSIFLFHLKLKYLKYIFVIMYWKEKETHIHFECCLYQRCIVCVNESDFKY